MFPFFYYQNQDEPYCCIWLKKLHNKAKAKPSFVSKHHHLTLKRLLQLYSLKQKRGLKPLFTLYEFPLIINILNSA